MSKTEFLELMDELFELDPGTIQGSDELQQTPGWGSLTFLGLIAMVDDELGIGLQPKSILSCRTINDLIALLGDEITEDSAAAA